MNNTTYYSFILFCILFLVFETNAQRSSAKNSKDKTSIFDRSIFGKSQRVVCDSNTEKKLDSFANKLLTSHFPTSTRELRQFCNAGIKSAGFILGFAKHCLTEFTQKAIQVVFHPITNEIAQICKSGRPSSKAREIIKASACGNAARPGLRKCYHNFIEREISIQKSVDAKKKIPMLCCEFNLLRECFKNEAEELKICTKRTVDFVERYALEMFGEILNLMCFDYSDGSDRCNKVIKEIPNVNFTGIAKPKSFIPPMLGILKDISDF